MLDIVPRKATQNRVGVRRPQSQASSTTHRADEFAAGDTSVDTTLKIA
jgi:hypothetical protein